MFKFLSIFLVWRRHFRSDSGAAALEFILLASLLAPILLAVADVGKATRQSMLIDAILRIGAEGVMRGEVDSDVIGELVEFASATYRDGALSNLDVTVERRYFCSDTIFDPEASTIGNDRPVTCSAPQIAAEAVMIEASQTFRGLVLGHTFSWLGLDTVSARIWVEIPSR